MASHSRKAALPALGHRNHMSTSAWEWGSTTSICLCSVPASVPLVHCTALLEGGGRFQGIKPVSSPLPTAMLPCMARPAGYHHGFSSETGNCLRMAALSWRWPGTELELQGLGSSLPYSPHECFTLPPATCCLWTWTALLRASPVRGSLIHLSSSKEKWFQCLVQPSSEALAAPLRFG